MIRSNPKELVGVPPGGVQGNPCGSRNQTQASHTPSRHIQSRHLWEDLPSLLKQIFIESLICVKQ